MRRSGVVKVNTWLTVFGQSLKSSYLEKFFLRFTTTMHNRHLSIVAKASSSYRRCWFFSCEFPNTILVFPCASPFKYSATTDKDAISSTLSPCQSKIKIPPQAEGSNSIQLLWTVLCSTAFYWIAFKGLGLKTGKRKKSRS